MLVGPIYKRLLLPSMFWRASSRAQPHIPHLWTRLACNLGLIGGRASVDGVTLPSCRLHELETCWEGAFLNTEGANGRIWRASTGNFAVRPWSWKPLSLNGLLNVEVPLLTWSGHLTITGQPKQNTINTQQSFRCHSSSRPNRD